MHSAVMQNKKYIKYADDNTVEVLSLGSLEKGVEAADPKAEKYTAKGPDGVEREYMVEWPNLTFDEIVGLNRSPAGQFNKSGAIPYTSIVDPHTLTEVTAFKGGTSGKAIIEAADELKKTLRKEHGEGLSRKLVRDIQATPGEVKELVADEDYTKALTAVDKILGKYQDLPETLKETLTTARADVITSATARLDEVIAMDAKEAKRELSRLIRKLKGTGLEDRAREALKAL